jgi:hypothetical protein
VSFNIKFDPGGQDKTVDTGNKAHEKTYLSEQQVFGYCQNKKILASNSKIHFSYGTFYQGNVFINSFTAKQTFYVTGSKQDGFK